MDNVLRFLVTGNPEQQLEYFRQVRDELNCIEQRKNTVFYTAFERSRALAISAAQQSGVTLEQLHLNEYQTTEVYERLVGDGPGQESSQ